MAKKWTLANAVKKFKPNQKKSLNRNGGNLNVDEFNSLIKEMKCYYEEVKPYGIGRDRIIWTDKKLKEKAKNGDKRQYNKGVAPPHSKHLALMVMSKTNSIDNKSRTIKGWATYFGLISPAETDVMKGVYSVEAIKPYKEFMIKLGIIEDGEENVFQDLAYTLTKVAKGQLQTVLNQAEGKLINRISSWKGKVKGSKEQIDIDEAMATEIKKMEAELLKKHGVNIPFTLMYRNSRKTKAFNAEWLEYIENVEDAEGDAMHLQYIYEVFRIEVLNAYAFDEYIKAHYPTEVDSFNLIKNEELYHSKLFDYVADNAQKKRDNYLKKEHEKPILSEEGMKEILSGLGLTEDEAIAYIEQQPEVDAYAIVKELTPYMVLLQGDGYVDCIKKIHIHLHRMNAIESQEVKAVQRRIDEHIKKELEQLGVANPAKVKNEKSGMNGVRNNHETCMNPMEQQDGLTQKRIKQQANQTLKKIELEIPEQQGISIVDNPNVEPSKHCSAEGYYEYQAAMEDIRDEIRWYVEKHGDKAMKHIALDNIVRELKREFTAEEMFAGLTHQQQCLKEQERKEWEKLFEGGQPVKWELTTNDPLEVFKRIRHGRG